MLKQQNDLLKQQQDELAQTAAEAAKTAAETAKATAATAKAAAAAAALDTYRNSVKSLADAMLTATKQFADFTGAFDKAQRAPVSAMRLATRMQGQLTEVEDWANALKQLKGKVSGALYSELMNLGPSAADELMALASDQQALNDYASAWQQKYDIAAGVGVEAAASQYQVDQMIQSQVINITVVSNDPQAAAAAVVKKLRLAGVR